MLVTGRNMDTCISCVLLICGLATFANGQLQNGLLETGIGYYDGHQVRADDFTDQRLGGRFSQNVLPTVRDIGRLGAERRHQGAFSGGLGGSLGHFGPDRMRSCQINVCALQFIQPRCRYTPVLRSTFGNCLGCPEDVCETQRRMTPRERRRRRRIRRRLCRNFGVCLGGQSGSRLGNVIPGL